MLHAQLEVQWAIFRGNSNSPSLFGPRPFTLTGSERNRAWMMQRLVGANNGDDDDDDDDGNNHEPRGLDSRSGSIVVDSKRTAPFKLIKDIKAGTVVSLMGTALGIEGGRYPGRCVMYITDYTSNASLINYGGQEPHTLTGQLTLSVTLWEPHSTFARTSLEWNSIVLLTYVHIKQMKGYNMGCVEASVHTDRLFPDKLHVHTVGVKEDERARELVVRRDQYWKRGGRTEANGSDNNFPRTNGVVANGEAAKKASAPFTLIKDVNPGSIVSLIGEVTGVDRSHPCVIYVTDFTSSDALGDYRRFGDEYGYLDRKRPKGQVNSLQVTLWEPHDDFARTYLAPKSLVLLNYVHVKRKRDYDGCIEASVHTDRWNQGRLHIQILDAGEDDGVRELLRRKEKYLESEEGDTNGTANASKTKKRKKEKKQERRVEEGQKDLASDKIAKRHQRNKNSEMSPSPKSCLERLLFPFLLTTSPVQCFQVTVPCQSLEEIVNNESHDIVSPEGLPYRLPFQNICYRSSVRVVDFFPPKIEDFAVPVNPEFEDDSDRDYDSDIPEEHRRVVWEWRFCLIVESHVQPPPGIRRVRVNLFVSRHDAEHLLKLTATEYVFFPVCWSLSSDAINIL